MNELLDCVQVDTGTDPRWTVLWLHGLGADGHDFEPIVPELVRPAWPALRFLFPHAPVRPVTINGGMRMRAWYDITGMEIAQRQDEAGIRGSLIQVEALIAREAARGVAASRVILAGFSQGGAIALACAVRRQEPLAGMVGLSCYLPLGAHTAAEASTESRATPAFLGHGWQDPVVPQVLGERSRDFLTQLGYDVTWRSYGMPHSVCAEEIHDLADWLEKRFQSAD
ncbi:MAG TPA: alpha/beta hydrolase fold domain-containing protein [Xanthomonadaceae bacterium]|nr:alpha/beta hydrolase fold domain-containing protein [Xanthomonadaceae bacterium]